MQFTVGSTPVTVTELGRFYVSGSGTHTVKLVQANTGADVPGGSVSLSIAGGTTGQFQYAALATPVTLQINTTYYLVSQETIGGDQWYDQSSVTSTGVAVINGPVYGSGSWVSIGTLPGETYGPVDFRYQ
jgi:hypothetical protein